LLKRHEGIKVSKTFLRELFLKNYILSPLATRKIRASLKKCLEEKIKETNSKKEQKQLHNSIVTLEDAHPRRPRARYFGELIQLDASIYIWFGNIEAYLHLAVDDCTGSIVGVK